MPSTSGVISSGDQDLDSLLSGVRWSTSQLTYSFPTSASQYGSFYSSTQEQQVNFAPLNATQQAAARTAFAMYASVAQLTFTEITETSSTHADLRLSRSDAPYTAWAYYPHGSAAGGDAWFNNSSGWYASPAKGNYAWLTFVHEIGHSLGLKHAHEYPAMPSAHDSMEFTVMTYRSYVGQVVGGGYTNGSASYAQTPMMYDIAALQYMYGANYASRSGDTTYKWHPGSGELYIDGVGQGAPAANRVLMTIWDGGGNDTYDLSLYTTGVAADLRPGEWTITSQAQLANLGDGHSARGNVANALLYGADLRSLIENVTGGAGGDTLVGNDVANVIVGNAGADALDGGAGNDVLEGGTGNDTLLGGAGVDIARFAGARSGYSVAHAGLTLTVSGADGTDTLSGVERLQFGDALINLLLARLDAGGDGRSDIAWRGADGSVLLWQMNGTQVSASTAIGTMASNWSIVDAQGDYNGDGRSDVLWRADDGTVLTWQLNGAQASAAGVGSPGAFGPAWSILNAHCDYDGDGRSDILWQHSDGTVWLWQMNGTQIGASALVGVADRAFSVLEVQGDYNGDGRADVLWRHSDGRLVLWQMNGAQVGSVGLGTRPSDWTLLDGQGDYNADGKSDLLWRDGGGTLITWLMDGGTAREYVLRTPGSTWSVLTGHGDYNADGRSDVVLRDNSDGRVITWLMDGAQFSGHYWGTMAPDWRLIDAQADYDGDGASDLVWRGADGHVVVWQMDGAHVESSVDVGVLSPDRGAVEAMERGAVFDGGAGAETFYGTLGRDTLRGGEGNDTLVAEAGADVLDGGGGIDVLEGGAGNDTLLGGAGVDIAQFAGMHSGYTVARAGLTLTVTGADGTDTLSGVERLQFGDALINLLLARLDAGGDGRSDIAWRGADGSVLLWQMNGPQVSASTAIGTMASNWSIVDAQGDYNGDGRSDVLWRADDGTVLTWQLNGAQASAAGVGSPGAFGPAWSILNAHCDYDGDGRSDILWQHSDGTVWLWQMNGAQIGASALVGVADRAFSVLEVQGDYNGDGRADVLWRHSDGRLVLWQMNGAQVASVGLGTRPSDWTLLDGQGDYNADGKSDLLWRDGSGTLITWLMDGGTAREYVLRTPGSTWSVLTGHGDYNADGRSDVVLRDNSDGRVITWLMDGAQFSGHYWGTMAPGWSLLDANADYDGDGRSDLLWRGSDGHVTVWRIDGPTLLSSTDLGVMPLERSAVEAADRGAIFSGGAGADTLYGTLGSDTLQGGDGNDTLVGEAGADVLDGGAGNDVLEGGAGRDTLTGGAGSDRFDFNALGGGPDTIIDFTAGAGGDVLDIRDVLVGYAPGISNASSFVQLSEAAGATTVAVDADGIGGNFVDLALLQAASGLTLNDLLASGNLLMG